MRFADVRTAALLTFIVAIAPMRAMQAPANFEGRWRLVKTGAAPDVADTVVVLHAPSPEVVLLERGFPDGVRVENYGIGSARRGAYYPAKWMGPSLVLTRIANVKDRAQPELATAKHEEIWTLLPGNVLNIDATDTTPGTAATTRHFTYNRVPQADAIVPGQNLLENPDGAAGRAGWIAPGHATVEPCGNHFCFVLRDQATFSQTVVFPTNAIGKFVVVLGSGTAEQINPDGAITGLPSLHSTIAVADTGKILISDSVVSSPLGRLHSANEWATFSGFKEVRAGAMRLSIQLTQALARGTPNNGAPTRFDRLGVFLFSSEAEARSFIEHRPGR